MVNTYSPLPSARHGAGDKQPGGSGSASARRRESPGIMLSAAQYHSRYILFQRTRPFRIPCHFSANAFIAAGCHIIRLPFPRAGCGETNSTPIFASTTHSPCSDQTQAASVPPWHSALSISPSRQHRLLLFSSRRFLHVDTISLNRRDSMPPGNAFPAKLQHEKPMNVMA